MKRRQPIIPFSDNPFYLTVSKAFVFYFRWISASSFNYSTYLWDELIGLSFPCSC